jgi:hypothetical protein
LSKERKPIRSLLSILKTEFDKSENDEMETVEKGNEMETVEKEKILMDREPSHSHLGLGRANTRTHLRVA